MERSRLSCQSCNVILLCDIAAVRSTLPVTGSLPDQIKYKLLQLFEGESVHAVYILGEESLSNNEFNMCDLSGRQMEKGVCLFQLVPI